MKSLKPASLQALCNLVDGQLVGDDQTINAVATLEDASAGSISFLSNSKYRSYLKNTQASAVILSAQDTEACPVSAIVVDDPYLAYARIAAHLSREDESSTQNIHPTAIIAESATIGQGVSIGAYSVIGNNVYIGDGCKIGTHCSFSSDISLGANSRLYDGVHIYSDVTIGERAIFHSGVVLGADGFGIANNKGVWEKVPQLGGVCIGNDVEIGANTAVDRGAIEPTIIGDGVKLDNLIQVAHNVKIGDHTAIAACVGIAGSAEIGSHCAIGGGAGILGHLTIADNVHITATSLVTKSVPNAGVYSSGTPLQANSDWHKNFVRFKQLDEMAKRIKNLESELSRVDELTQKLKD